MANLFLFEVHTPYRLFFSGKVEGITVNLPDGEIGIYAGHSFITAPVLTGILKIRDDTGVWKPAYTSEGILEVSGHKTILMVDAAEWPGEIDPERAESAKTRAQERIGTGALKFDTDNARLDLKRAETRLKVYALRADASS
ncbi:MAG: ATP synthase F1 subunit epsilon [Spirochaetaceae bacterium]|jgi:F-type H+-transporting ATPase subunit epsilon|nr:ATP synthase F1 subunit epsilon [Spirochaetaceae bacterium]